MIPFHILLDDLAQFSLSFVDDSRARRYWIERSLPIFSKPSIVAGLLSTPTEWMAVQEMAAASLHVAELEGDVHAQKTFLAAIKTLAPLTSPQREWAVQRLTEIALQA